MSEHTHTVVGKQHIRSAGRDDADAEEGEPYVVYEVGDEITPTEAELASAPYRFEAIGEEPEEADEADEATSPDVGFTADDVEDADYPELRSMAGDFEDINGNASEEDLREALLDKVG